jgi:alpha-beta hydrolase superfamily lysophospholipase
MSSTQEALGAYAWWPENPFWSFQVLRLIEQTNVGGADFSELYGALRDIPVGDGEAWFEQFGELAASVEATADGDAALGHRVSARDGYLRASNYHRSAGFFLSPADPRHAARILARRRCFMAAAELSRAAIEPVEIPYGEETLPGYKFRPAERTQRPGPAVITFGGSDAVAEEMYFFIGRSLVERGFTVLAMDGPGQGEALRRGIVGRPDWEVPVGAAVDFLSATEQIDPDRLFLIGQSLGGYYAPRAAAFEPRIRGTVVWGAVYDLTEALELHQGMTREHFIELFKRILGIEAEGEEELWGAVREYSLEGISEQIETPILVVHGEDDQLAPVEQARRLHAEAATADKDLIVYPSGQPGCTHCQIDALALVQRDICNWVEARSRRED